MLLGTSETSLDSKGRFTLALCFRKSLDRYYKDEELVLWAHDNCLHVYPKSESDYVINKMQDKQKNEDSTSFHANEFELFNYLDIAESDEQNRVSVRSHLREKAGLTIKSKVKAVGYRTHVRIWDLAYIEQLTQKKEQKK